jgi:hypothetical protein
MEYRDIKELFAPFNQFNIVCRKRRESCIQFGAHSFQMCSFWLHLESWHSFIADTNLIKGAISTCTIFTIHTVKYTLHKKLFKIKQQNGNSNSSGDDNDNKFYIVMMMKMEEII